jgi:hypothetical protein
MGQGTSRLCGRMESGETMFTSLEAGFASLGRDGVCARSGAMLELVVSPSCSIIALGSRSVTMCGSSKPGELAADELGEPMGVISGTP